MPPIKKQLPYDGLDQVGRLGKFINAPPSVDQIRRAALVIAANSKSLDDCRMLLSMLGINHDNFYSDTPSECRR